MNFPRCHISALVFHIYDFACFSRMAFSSGTMTVGKKMCDIISQDGEQWPIKQYSHIPATIECTLMDIHPQSVLIKVLSLNKVLDRNVQFSAISHYEN